jgi:hypothetical protein
MSDLSSLTTNFFSTANEGFITTTSGTVDSSTDTVVPLNSVAGLTNGSVFTGIIDPGVAKERAFTGVVDTSGAQITTVVFTTGSNATHTTGATVVDYVTGTEKSAATKGILIEHNQDGTHSDITADTVTAGSFTTTGGASSNGWTVGASIPSAVVYSGNGSYTLTHASSVADTDFVGAKNKYTRTVTAPAQCADLDGSTQYFNKTSPAGMTFTDDFSCGAWVKLTSYPTAGQTGEIISRWSTNGWIFRVSDTGAIQILGSSGGNTDNVTTLQSLPLNRWVYVTATLNMAGSAATTYIGGVSVPNTYSNSAATSLAQAGDLTVGARSGGTQFFPGKIAQAFVASKVLSATEVKAIYSQGIVAGDVATYSIVSAFSLSGASGLTDINTTNANNLTAQGSATTTTDDTGFTQSVVGTSLTAGTTNYSVTTSISEDGLTSTVQTAEGDTIPTSGGITAVSYSTQGVPYGFPRDEGKWAVSSIYLDSLNQTITAPVFEPLIGVEIDVPIGVWEIGFRGTATQSNSSSGIYAPQTALSTISGSTATDVNLISRTVSRATGTSTSTLPASASNFVRLSALTKYYLLTTSASGGGTIDTGIGAGATIGSFIVDAKFNLL